MKGITIILSLIMLLLSLTPCSDGNNAEDEAIDVVDLDFTSRNDEDGLDLEGYGNGNVAQKNTTEEHKGENNVSCCRVTGDDPSRDNGNNKSGLYDMLWQHVLINMRKQESRALNP